MHQFKCPECGYIFQGCEGLAGHVTFWGEDGPQDTLCPGCEAEFTVEERVERTFEVRAKPRQPSEETKCPA